MTTQISLSLELMCLLNWLLKHEKNALSSLIKQAIEHGLIDELQKADFDEAQPAEVLYSTLLDFLDFLEQSLIKNLENIHVDNKTKDAILPALQKIETDCLDFKTMWLSMQHTKVRVSQKQQSKISRSPKISMQQTPKDILFEELLKNWKPNNKEIVN